MDAGHSAAVDERVAYLEHLGRALTVRGWHAAVAQPLGDPPFLRVTNPELALLTDAVSCVLTVDGAWSYAWQWGEPVGPVDDLPGAVEKVTRVLGAGVEA